MEDTKFWVAIATNNKIGPARFDRLAAFFKNMEKAWEASSGELVKAGLEGEVIESFLETKRTVNPDKVMAKLANLGIKVLTLKSKDYPKLLKEIPAPPPVLYIKGELKKEDGVALGVVGTRKMTVYGKRVTEEIVWGITKNGLTIISGLALGVDSIAHKTTLSAGGRTLAILGSGLDQIYPVINKSLADKISQNGALISEFPLGTEPLRQNFPRRNRIISGLSLGVLIIEAAEISGALITARSAIEQNREVFAVPGSIFSPQSIGPNNLIKMGAKLVTNFSDILDELNIKEKYRKKEKRKIDLETEEEKILFNLLDRERPVYIDKLIEKTKIDTALVNSTLIMLEIKGLVKNIGGGQYIRT